MTARIERENAMRVHDDRGSTSLIELFRAVCDDCAPVWRGPGHIIGEDQMPYFEEALALAEHTRSVHAPNTQSEATWADLIGGNRDQHPSTSPARRPDRGVGHDGGLHPREDPPTDG